LKKEPETLPNIQNPLQTRNISNTESENDPLKLEEWNFPLNISRGNSQAGDFGLSRFNSLSGQRIPSSLDINFSQSKNKLF